MFPEVSPMTVQGSARRSPPTSADVTRLIQRVHSGDEEARGDLWTLVYDELRHLAASQMSRERMAHTLQPTALVHEAWHAAVADRARRRVVQPRGVLPRRRGRGHAAHPHRAALAGAVAAIVAAATGGASSLDRRARLLPADLMDDAGRNPVARPRGARRRRGPPGSRWPSAAEVPRGEASASSSGLSIEETAKALGVAARDRQPRVASTGRHGSSREHRGRGRGVSGRRMIHDRHDRPAGAGQAASSTRPLERRPKEPGGAAFARAQLAASDDGASVAEVRDLLLGAMDDASDFMARARGVDDALGDDHGRSEARAAGRHGQVGQYTLRAT